MWEAGAERGRGWQDDGRTWGGLGKGLGRAWWAWSERRGQAEQWWAGLSWPRGKAGRGWTSSGGGAPARSEFALVNERTELGPKRFHSPTWCSTSGFPYAVS